MSSLSRTSSSPVRPPRPRLQAAAKPRGSLVADHAARAGCARPSTSRYSRVGVGRVVVDDDHLVGRLVGVRKHALEREPGAGEIVADRDTTDADRAAPRRPATAGTGRPSDVFRRFVAELRGACASALSSGRSRGKLRPVPASSMRARRPRARREPDVVEHVAEHDLVAQVLARDLARGAAVARRVRLHGRRPPRRPRRGRRTRTGPRRSAGQLPKPVSCTITGRPGGQVGDAALAEPAACGSGRSAPWRPRPRPPSRRCSRGRRPGRARSPARAHPPAVLGQQQPVAVVVAGERELDRRPVRASAGRGSS